MATPASLAGLLLPLDRASPVPLHRQVYAGLRDSILSGRLPAGTRVPSTRYLAQYLAVSRTTTLIAFDQLVVNGRQPFTGLPLEPHPTEAYAPLGICPARDTVPGVMRHSTEHGGQERVDFRLAT